MPGMTPRFLPHLLAAAAVIGAVGAVLGVAAGDVAATILACTTTLGGTLGYLIVTETEHVTRVIEMAYARQVAQVATEPATPVSLTRAVRYRVRSAFGTKPAQSADEALVIAREGHLGDRAQVQMLPSYAWVDLADCGRPHPGDCALIGGQCAQPESLGSTTSRHDDRFRIVMPDGTVLGTTSYAAAVEGARNIGGTAQRREFTNPDDFTGSWVDIDPVTVNG